MSNENIAEGTTIVPTTFEKHNNIFSQGDLLYWKCEYEKAKKYFQMVLNQPSISLLDSARCYNSLGAVNTKLQDYEEALNNYRRQLDILTQLNIQNETEGDIIKCYMSIGMVYWLQDDYSQAVHYHIQALDALPSVTTAPNLTSNIYKNLANLYTKLAEFDSALSYFDKALEIDRQNLREDHLKFGQTYANIGAMYHSKQDYKQALKYFEKARETWLKSLPSSHIYIESMEKTIGTVQSMITPSDIEVRPDHIIIWCDKNMAVQENYQLNKAVLADNADLSGPPWPEYSSEIDELICSMEPNLNKKEFEDLIKSPLRMFTNENECMKCIKDSLDAKKQPFVITSGEKGALIVPQIHKELSGYIYIFCGQRVLHETWTQPFKNDIKIYDDERSVFAKVLLHIGVYYFLKGQNETANPAGAIQYLQWARRLIVNATKIDHINRNDYLKSIEEQLFDLRAPSSDGNDSDVKMWEDAN